jgi:dienelactone hydrolase
MERSARFSNLACVASFAFLACLAASCAQLGEGIATSPAWRQVFGPAELDAPDVEWIHVDARGGHKMLAAVIAPASGRHPVVVILPGALGFKPGYIALARELSQAGFVAVVGCWQAFASPPLPKADPVCAEAPPQAAWQDDPAGNHGKELIAAVRTLPRARPDRVGLYGISRGGNAALWAGSTGAAVQAIVVDAPAHRPPRVDSAAGTVDGLPGLSVPTLILHGTADRLVPVEQTREYEKAARLLGKPVTVAYYEGSGHMVSYTNGGREPAALAKARESNMVPARQRAIAFLREHLSTP